MFINKNVTSLKGVDLSKGMNKLKDIKHMLLLKIAINKVLLIVFNYYSIEEVN